MHTLAKCNDEVGFNPFCAKYTNCTAMAGIMSIRSQIDDSQRKILFERFEGGMNSVNKTTEDLRSSVAKESGLTLQSVNVNIIIQVIKNIS